MSNNLAWADTVNPCETSAITADFPYKSNYIEVLGSKMHYIDVGSGKPILFIHGNSGWSYVWRNIIPFVIPQGRAIAVDLMGMGKSDKPAIDYSFADHYRYLEAFIAALNLQDITLVVHDWGSTLGFHYASRHKDNVRGIAFMEAFIPPFFPVDNIQQMGEELAEVFGAVRSSPEGQKLVYERNIFIEELLSNAILRDLSDAELAAYRCPYLQKPSRKPLLVWASQIPIAGEPPETETIINQYSEWLRQTTIPKLHFYVSPGGSLNPPEVAQWTAQHFPNIETHYLGEGLHYLEEDYPEEIGRAIADWLRRIETINCDY
ncbi:haloalkane dehalogenase [Xenococcus sp. PCC 7305]|uniref:haloalkane dehalogenase n=1 Tax=Xenococcus sp. PCC 7305 TaxID=102125 RepID=UPI00130EAFD5|nr:haloalkane dehalogenase [Xenococcus sp. PCC 7305]